MEELRMMEDRMRETEAFDDFEKKEAEFHAAQSVQRTAIRIKEGRQKPVDILATNLMLSKGLLDGSTGKVHVDPVDVLKGLSPNELVRDVSFFQHFNYKIHYWELYLQSFESRVS